MADFTLSQTAAQLQALMDTASRLTDSNMAAAGFGCGISDTPDFVAEKRADVGMSLMTGCVLAILFNNGFSTSGSTLNVDGTARAIKLFGSAIAPGKVRAGSVVLMQYDGTDFNVLKIMDAYRSSNECAVDLGLPSGLLWCDHNVGATSPSGFGQFFAWGDVTGHAHGSSYNFSQANYEASEAAAIMGHISPRDSYDMARKNMGGQWRLPTAADWSELITNCQKTAIQQDGIYGLRLTGGSGNSIFLPAGGYVDGTTAYYYGAFGFYWSSSYKDASQAFNLLFQNITTQTTNSQNRWFGLPVRAVM